MEKQRTLVFLLLMVLGAGLLAYGLHSDAAIATTGEQGSEQVAVQPMSEVPVAPEAAQSGVAQGGPGQTPKAPAEAKKAPAACPT